MEFRQVKYFLEIVHRGSFVSAAAHLGLTQPALSRQIALLERELGVDLLDRQGREIRITHAGEQFHAQAIELQEMWKSIKESVRSEDEPLTGEYSISTGGTIAAFVLPSLLREIRKNHSELTFRIYEGDARQTRESLLNGETDLGIFTADVETRDLISHPFITDTMNPVVGPDHPLARAKKLKLADLREHDFVLFHSGSSIRQTMDKTLRSVDPSFIPRVSMELRSLESVLRCVKAGLGIGYVSSLCIADSDLRILPIPELVSKRVFRFHYRSRRRKGLVKLINIIEELTARGDLPTKRNHS